MCTLKEFLREILDNLVNITGWCFLGWFRMKWVASCIAVMNWIFFGSFHLNELTTAIMHNINKINANVRNF